MDNTSKERGSSRCVIFGQRGGGEWRNGVWGCDGGRPEGDDVFNCFHPSGERVKWFCVVSYIYFPEVSCLANNRYNNERVVEFSSCVGREPSPRGLPACPWQLYNQNSSFSLPFPH